MKNHCIECSFFTEEPGELYAHFMNAHTKIPVKPARGQSHSLDCFASWGFKLNPHYFFKIHQATDDVWGKIAGIYLENPTVIFSKLSPEFNFTRKKNKTNSRNYNASDEINALLNYGYSILESEIRKAINGIGLDYSIELIKNVKKIVTLNFL